MGVQITDELVERMLMAFLEKPHNPFPHIDWEATRSAPLSWWRQHMRAALETVFVGEHSDAADDDGSAIRWADCAAAVKWCSDVQCRIPEDILHFLENWWLVPELRVYVERECAK